MHILIADDERAIREGVRRTINSSFPEYTVHLAASPEEAVQVLSQQPVDIVLTDIIMPGMTGLELMRISRRRHPHVKWIVISAHSEFAYAQEAVRLGAKDYLLKPIGKEKLIELMKAVAEERQHENDLTREKALLKSNLKYWREAVFQRWAAGLDTGQFDMASLMDNRREFYLVMVKLEGEAKAHLEHFIIENVLSELIDTYGSGFVASFDSHSLLGILTLGQNGSIEPFMKELNGHLHRYLKVPFQAVASGLLRDPQVVPAAVQSMRQQDGRQQGADNERRSESVTDVALQYIHAHFQDELSLEKVASVVFLNPVYFSQLFKQKTGQGFKDYVIRLRLERAKVLLQDPTLKLADVAEKIGYQDMRHFTQLFRKRFELTPTDYRQQLKQLK
ncbi:response regulator [Paenibacillus thalictri]|uniref:Response regulator n=1 Tax=Paenibacillus thalictri TaxID=2527873 RepID=A0A4Q9DZJ9_9BACL|nr:response regulator [Paenibacillus thalictri]TBL81570.1 response regulator [Paenibacillus thalictri]